MSDILYTYKNSVYFNITNKCPCNCEFCIRSMGEGVGSAQSLWLESEPSLKEILSHIDVFDFEKYKEAVFCGYGEPLCAFDNLIAVCKYLRKKYPALKIRVNTNGLGDLINETPTAKTLCKNIDSVSISMNAPTAEKYNAITRPVYGLSAFDAMLNFARKCKRYLPDVTLTVVDTICKSDIEECKKLSDEMGIKFRTRNYGE